MNRWMERAGYRATRHFASRTALARGLVCGCLIMASGCFNPDDPEADAGSSGGTSPASSGIAATGGTTPDNSDTVSQTAGPSDDSLDGASSSGAPPTDSTTAGDDDPAVTSTGETPLCEVDGLLSPTEACDDGNDQARDGCTACEVDQGWVCAGEPSTCAVQCSPLLQDCADSTACYPHGEDFGCVVDASGGAGQYGQTCTASNGCDPGLWCAVARAVPGCNGAGCCSSFCDLSDPNATATCPGEGAGQQCLPWFRGGTAPVGLESIGYCGAP